MDRAWWHEYGPRIPASAEAWTTNREAARIYRLNWIRGEVGEGLAKASNSIKLGGNSGYQAVGLALHFGAARVVLLGFDMQRTGGKSHWHGDHARLGNPLDDKMRDWRRRFAALARETRVPIVNATRETALDCFPRVELHEALSS
jgi:hypothetical protein